MDKIYRKSPAGKCRIPPICDAFEGTKRQILSTRSRQPPAMSRAPLKKVRLASSGSVLDHVRADRDQPTFAQRGSPCPSSKPRALAISPLPPPHLHLPLETVNPGFKRCPRAAIENVALPIRAPRSHERDPILCRRNVASPPRRPSNRSKWPPRPAHLGVFLSKPLPECQPPLTHPHRSRAQDNPRG